MDVKANLVDTFLADAKGKEDRVKLYLANGHKIEGTVREFDYSSVVVEVKGKLQTVLRQGIVSCCVDVEKTRNDEPEKSKMEMAS